MVSVVIPTFNRLKDLNELIGSLLAANKSSDIEIIIVDNNSHLNYDEIMHKIRSSGIPVTLLINETEGSLSKSRNMGIQAAKGEFIFFIDDDNIVEINTIQALLDVFKNNTAIGILSPIAFYYDDRNRILDCGAKRSYQNSFTVNLFLNEDKGILPDGIVEVSEVSNAFMVRKAVFERISFFDELNFPIDLDEADLCLRTKKAGFKIFVVTYANIYHKVARINSLAVTSLRFRREKNAYNMGRNRILFQRKYLSFIKYLFFLILYFPIFCYLYIFSLLLPQPGSNFKLRIKFMHRFIEGISDGLFMNLKS